MCCGAATSSTPRPARPRRPRVPLPQNRTRRPGSGAPSTAASTTSPSRRWGRPSPRPSAATCRSTTARTCSTSRTRSSSAGSCSTARPSSRRGPSTSSPPPGSSSRSTTGSAMPATPWATGTSWCRCRPACRVVEHPRGPPEPVMRIAGNVSVGGTLPDGSELPLFRNQVSHWWDGSEVYGTDEEAARKLRDGAKLRLSADGYLPLDARGAEMTGFNESWWIGLSGLHTLFAREHNLLCDELRANYRGWSDERVYQTARLIVSALIAKIHTVEWTPAILATKTLDIGMNTNWNGPPARDWLARLGIWLVDAQAGSGIPSTRPDHHGAPYSLTEDFVTVYRMHPLLPDDYLLPRPPVGRAAGPARLPPDPGGQGRRRAAHDRPADPALLVRDLAPGRHPPAQLSPLAPGVRARRRAHRPLGGRPGAHPPARRAPLQRLPRGPAQAPDQALGGAVRGPRVGPAPPRGLPQHRRGRHDGRPVRRDAARRVRLLRHRLPDLHPDGVAPAAERPLPDGRLPPRDLLAVRHGLDRQQRHDQRHPPSLPGAGVGPPARRNAFAPWRPVAAGRTTEEGL